MASLSLKQIRKTYDGGAEIIKGVDLEIRDGEFMVFVGPSGCGKSTLLRMIAGLEELSDGELWIGEREVADVAPSDRGVAMVFQSYALYPHMTVAENMGFALKLAKHSKEEVAAAVGRAAEILQISHLLDRKPKALSGGQRQRVAIGRAIVRSPKVFLFDEPLSNLDAALRVQMRTELARLHRELGTTMIYVTHDQVEAMTLGQRIAVFNAGRIAQVGAPMDLYDAPANLFVAGFLGSPKMNLLPVTVSVNDGSGLHVRSRAGDARFALAPARAGAPAVGTEATLGFRPDQVALAEPGAPGPVIVRLPGHADPLPAGSRVALRPDLARSRLFDSRGEAFELSA
jgi:multiple sugar transport system ATP-binding protein